MSASDVVAVEEVVEDSDETEGIGEPTECFSCGGTYSWCNFCQEWTQTCCVDYGNCYCS